MEEAFREAAGEVFFLTTPPPPIPGWAGLPSPGAVAGWLAGWVSSHRWVSVRQALPPLFAAAEQGEEQRARGRLPSGPSSVPIGRAAHKERRQRRLRAGHVGALASPLAPAGCASERAALPAAPAVKPWLR